MASNPVMEPRSKHIDIRYHRIRKSVAKGNVELFFIDGVENPADLLTKNLPHEKFVKFRAQLGLPVSLWQHLVPYSLKCSTCSTVRGSVEVAHAPGVNHQQSAHKTVTHISVDLVIVLFRVDVTCHSHTSQCLLYINSVHHLYNITALDQLPLSSQVVHSTQQVSWSSSSSMYIGIASTTSGFCKPILELHSSKPSSICDSTS